MMPLADAYLAELDTEMPTTHRVLERVPSDKSEWKPHVKSFSLGHLAQLVSWMPGWIANSVREEKLDLATYPKYSSESTETLLREFDKNVAAARDALRAATDASLATTWSLTRGDQVLFTLERGRVVRMHINHLVHHRGQLTVYLRLLDVPVPMVYGPTADERM